MKPRTSLALIAAATIAAAPLAAQGQLRTSAPVEGESEAVGNGMVVLAVLVAVGIAVATLGADDDAIRP